MLAKERPSRHAGVAQVFANKRLATQEYPRERGAVNGMRPIWTQIVSLGGGASPANAGWRRTRGGGEGRRDRGWGLPGARRSLVRP